MKRTSKSSTISLLKRFPSLRRLFVKIICFFSFVDLKLICNLSSSLTTLTLDFISTSPAISSAFAVKTKSKLAGVRYRYGNNHPRKHKRNKAHHPHSSLLSSTTNPSLKDHKKFQLDQVKVRASLLAQELHTQSNAILKPALEQAKKLLKSVSEGSIAYPSTGPGGGYSSGISGDSPEESRSRLQTVLNLRHHFIPTTIILGSP